MPTDAASVAPSVTYLFHVDRPNHVEVCIDAESASAIIRFGSAPKARQVVASGEVLVDLDQAGMIVGLEIQLGEA